MRGFQQLIAVFTKPVYIACAVLSAWLLYSIAVFLPNLPLIRTVLFTTRAPLFEKVQFMISLYSSITTNFTPFSALVTILISVLFGVYAALLLYYILKMRALTAGARSLSAVGMSGVVSGFFGIGCAACGTFVLTSLFAVGGGGALISILPLDGQEFGLLGVALLSCAVYSLIQKLAEPLVC